MKITNNPRELALQEKVRKEAIERKKILLGLAKDIGFESRMFATEFKHNTKEPLRYYLWQMELHKWLGDMKKYINGGFMINHFMTHINVDKLEYNLIETLKILTDEARKK